MRATIEFHVGMRDKFDSISAPGICNRSVQLGQSDQSVSILKLIVRDAPNDFIYSLYHSDLILMLTRGDDIGVKSGFLKSDARPNFKRFLCSQ